MGIDPRTLAFLHCLAFFDLSGDDAVDLDGAVEAMEHVAYYLKRLPPDDLARLKAEMQTIATWANSSGLHPNFIDLVQNFIAHAGLEADE